MKKIKYQGGITKLISSKIGNNNKIKFADFIKNNSHNFIKEITDKNINLDIVSFSSKKDFYDQILSILSFVRYLGIPDQWTIYSDGSHNYEQVEFLNKTFHFAKVEILNWENLKCFPMDCKEQLQPYKDYLFDYAKNRPLGRKAFYYLNHKIAKPTLFLDADILFYKKATKFKTILNEDVDGWYLPDPDWGCLDTRYKEINTEQLYQLNGGFVLFNKELPNLIEALEFLKSINKEYEYFTDQTIFHILSRTNSFMPLDPRVFILDSSDQFDFSYLHTPDKIAIRHYTGPVRHKMWQKDWKWHLSIV